MKMKDSKLTKFIKKELVHGVGRNGSKTSGKGRGQKKKMFMLCEVVVGWLNSQEKFIFVLITLLNKDKSRFKYNEANNGK